MLVVDCRSRLRQGKVGVHEAARDVTGAFLGRQSGAEQHHGT
jgi:hypothetical protein